jgi:hypothetical protein
MNITGESGKRELRHALQFFPAERRLLPLHCYRGTLVPESQEEIMTQEQKDREPVEVERVQTGVRMEKRMLKVLKALAEQKDMTLGDLLEGIVLHAFEGKVVPFSAQTLKEIEQFKALYGMTLKASDSHNLKERKR